MTSQSACRCGSYVIGRHLAPCRAVEPRARLQALQAHLSAARVALKTGDRDRAREEVETALGIDPDFLAARVLREELDSPATPAVPPPAARPVITPAPAAASVEAYAAKIAELEEKVKQRVKNREATVAGPAAPPRPMFGRVNRLGALTAAAAAFGIVMTGSAVERSRVLPARPNVAAATLVESYAPEPLDPVRLAVIDDAPDVDVAPPPSLERPAVRPTPRASAPAAPPILAASLAPVVTPLPAPSAPASTVVTDSPPPAFVQRPTDEKTLVEDTLTRYRRAYNRLDARMAQAVYPAVNATALARAFDGLQSQSLVFNECDIAVRGGEATVTCRGTSRYVPKIGNRDARTESRVWDFTLRKAEGDWKIETARASR